MKVVHVGIVHRKDDTRILKKECASLARRGYNVTYVTSDCYGDSGEETNIQEADTRETEAESGTTAETGIEPLPGENDELRKATSENGNAAYFGARTTVVLNEETIDIKDRAGNVDAIYDIKAVDGRMP